MRRAGVAVLFTAILVLSACAVSVAEQYNNFLLDLDIIVRMEVSFAKVEQGDTGVFLKRDLDSLREDIGSVSWEDENAAAVSGQLDGAVRLLLESVEAREEGGAGAAEERYDEAVESFAQARMLLDRFK